MPSISFITRTTPTPAAAPKAILLFVGGVYYNQIDDTVGDTLGHFMTGPTGDRTSRLITVEDGLRVDNQKGCWAVMAAGIIQQIDGGGMAGEDYVNRALLSIEATLAYRNTSTVLGDLYTGPTGSFPAQAGHNGVVNTKKQDRIHNKSMFAHHAVEACQMYRDSPLQGDVAWAAYTARVDTIITQLGDFADWLSTDGPGSNIDDFFIRAQNTNQLVGVCYFLEEYGRLAGDSALRAMGQARMEEIFYGTATRLPKLSADGVFYEKQSVDGIGFDGSYMSFTLQTLGSYYESLDAGAWKDTVRDQLEESTLRWLQCISSEGVVSTVNPSVWTRVEQTYPSRPGLFPKGWNWDGISYRLHYLNELLGDDVVPLGLADLVMNLGKSFGHLDGGEDPEGSQFFIVLDADDVTEVEGLSASTDWAGINPIEREGGGACPDYPGGTLPDPVYILPIEVAYDLVHVEHSAYLLTLPYLEKFAAGFPPEL
jgi:hypothetical protein